MRFATPGRYDWEGWGESTAAIVAMGLALAVAGTVRTLETPDPQPVVAFELFVSLFVPTGLATGGVWLARHDVSADVRQRVATRVSIGVVVACALGGWLVGYVALEGGTISDPLSLVTILAAVGGATGFATGVRKPRPVPSAPSAAPSGVRESDCDSSADPSRATADDSESTADRSTETAETKAATDETAAGTAIGDDATPDASVTAEPASRAATSVDADTAIRPAEPVRPTGPAERDDSDTAVEMDPTSATDPGVDAVVSVPSTAETVLEVLRKERARLALAVLYHEWNGETRSVDALARAVSYHTDDSVDAVAVGLRHATLPELRAIRAVDWNPHADRVSASDHAVFEEGVREASVVLESFEPGTR
ncbi:hypothetical protein [Natrinema salaciae]|uniref:Uncharacterized protein n=1 Tax=Natrinema salaciae TaxID=1186196 RepID=A0A1H9BMT4_9EURY|nr:hypothetical protein [Natrinema salaciae]SEP90189.1 hypothetical protein SAMN04489841_0798 [Natrinema salaciae]